MNKVKAIDSENYQAKRDKANKLRIEIVNKKFENERKTHKDKLELETDMLKTKYLQSKKT